MSLVIAIDAPEGLILASDSRATYGDIAEEVQEVGQDDVKKLFKLGSHVGLAMVGQVDLGGAVVDAILDDLETKSHPGHLNDILPVVERVAQREFNRWFVATPEEERHPLNLRVCGYRYLGKRNKPRAYESAAYGLLSREGFVPRKMPGHWAMDGVPAKGEYLFRLISTPRNDIDTASRVAELVIHEVGLVHPSEVGGRTRLARITEQGGYAECSVQEVERMRAKNEQWIASLRASFGK